VNHFQIDVRIEKVLGVVGVETPAQLFLRLWWAYVESPPAPATFVELDEVKNLAVSSEVREAMIRANAGRFASRHEGIVIENLLLALSGEVGVREAVRASGLDLDEIRETLRQNFRAEPCQPLDSVAEDVARLILELKEGSGKLSGDELDSLIAAPQGGSQPSPEEVKSLMDACGSIIGAFVASRRPATVPELNRLVLVAEQVLAESARSFDRAHDYSFFRYYARKLAAVDVPSPGL